MQGGRSAGRDGGVQGGMEKCRKEELREGGVQGKRSVEREEVQRGRRVVREESRVRGVQGGKSVGKGECREREREVALPAASCWLCSPSTSSSFCLRVSTFFCNIKIRTSSWELASGSSIPSSLEVKKGRGG